MEKKKIKDISITASTTEKWNKIRKIFEDFGENIQSQIVSAVDSSFGNPTYRFQPIYKDQYDAWIDVENLINIHTTETMIRLYYQEYTFEIPTEKHVTLNIRLVFPDKK